MTPEELRRNEAMRWLKQGAKDQNAAQILLEAEPSRSVFHSQQAAEKATKAFLTFHQIAFRKTHDLTDLVSDAAVASLPLSDSLFFRNFPPRLAIVPWDGWLRTHA
jgi:HEPN domain-containing protein